MNNYFKVHKLNETGMHKAKEIQSEFERLAYNLFGVGDDEMTLNSLPREAKLCLTHLEKACFYAKKSMAIDKENQVDE